MKADLDQFDLLLDILKLYRKYGKNTFKLLSNTLNDESFLESLDIILEKTPERDHFIRKLISEPMLGKNKSSMDLSSEKSRLKPSTEDYLRNRIEKIKENDTTGYSSLNEVYLKLQNREYLPTQASFKSFANENNLIHLIKKDRKNSVYALMKYLIDLLETNHEIKTLVRSMEQTSFSDGGNTLSKWSNMIMGKKENK
jgi:hypothetical protein